MSPQETLQNQLRPFLQRMRGRSLIPRPVVQITADIEGTDKSAAVKMARQNVLQWVQERAGKLPDEAWAFEDFDHDVPGTPASVVTIKDDTRDYWVMRCEDPDKTIPGRTWVVEATVALQGDNAVFGLRLIMATREADPAFLPSIPGIVRQVVENPGLSRHDRPISIKPSLVANDDDLVALVDLIEEPRRRRPVYVVSLEEGKTDPATAVVNVEQLARRCLGTAHVAVVTGDTTYGISDEFGRQYSVWGGAVRTYRPGFDLDTDSPYTHPLAMRVVVENWGEDGARDFVDMLVRNAAIESLKTIDPERELPSFAKVMQIALKRKREEVQKTGSTDAELIELLEQELEEKGRQIEEWEALAIQEEQLRREAEGGAQEAVNQQYWMRERIKALEENIQEITGQSVDADVPIPDSYEKLGHWANQHLSGRLVLTGRAVRAAKGAAFEDVEAVYRAVLLLANEYRDMHLRGDNESFEIRCRELGLECCQSFAGSGAGRHGDEYFVQFGGRRRLLELHLKNSTSREPRRCLRVYFFWDDETEQVIVGSLPAHLKTRIT
ncbi:MAG: hypothetical protein IID50_03545 [Proteobacteria bacterium]|nr:hypothetical protein [Pseudomonadota bacterium]